jgi:hypothetical protein
MPGVFHPGTFTLMAEEIVSVPGCLPTTGN